MLTILQLFWCNSYIGCNKRNWNKSMSLFIIGSKFNFFLLNLTYTYFLFNKSLLFLSLFIKRRKKILFYLPKLLTKVIVRTTCRNLEDKIYIKKENYKNRYIQNICKWLFGLLTNAFMFYVEAHHKSLYVYGFPAVVVLLYERDYFYIVNECAILNIPVVGFVDTTQYSLAFDYAVPANISSSEFLYFYYKIFISYTILWRLQHRNKFFVDLINNYIIQKKCIILNKYNA